MQSRFGIKDFITLALLAAVLISVWLSMQQKTRIEVSLRDMKEQVAQVGTQVSRVDAELQRLDVLVLPDAQW